jgi:FHA domain
VTQTDDDQMFREIIAEGAAPDVEWTASAMLVVRRGPNAGSRFPLHQAVTSAGRDPRSDIFLDEKTVSRRHAEFRSERGEIAGRRPWQPQRHLRQRPAGRFGCAGQ